MTPAASKSKASFFQVMKAVLWSMLGVRQHKGYENDAAKITLKQAVIAGFNWWLYICGQHADHCALRNQPDGAIVNLVFLVSFYAVINTIFVW